MSSSKPNFSRGLSLEDLVNHDERSDAKAGQKANPLPSAEAQQRMSVDGSSSEQNGSTGSSRVPREQRGSRRNADGDEETDTDEEVGGPGDIVFETGDFKFDYEKQEGAGKNREARAGREDAAASSPASKVKREQDVKDIFQERASSQSKRNAIKKDLNVLSEIAATAKPSRYSTAPIWAQKWKPTVKALQSIDTKDLNIDASFTNIIPDDDLTKSVQDWVYATLVSIPPDQRQYVEMEMKFGIIVEGSDSNRVSPPVSSQTVYTDMDAHLTPDVDERVFTEINRYVKGISELSEYTGKFNIIESHTKDLLYRVGMSTQRPRFLRMSRDVKTGRVGEFIEKRHVSQLLLFSPKDSYDVKISINLELPVPDNDPPEKYKDNTPVNTRTKQRISYIHNDSCTRMDITKVANHNQGVKQRHTESTHEIELEVNTAALLAAFEHIGNNSKEYASILRTFLNNGTIIRRKLTSLSYEIFEGQKKV
ncbi:LAQU0S08e03070g1_1 [Lachancea quebecensis]|uniref:mRNA-capping enzyme subunit beta n=1 Tax=Lachancea quebecensis TaxID=1654605 RepID=A0A0P1KSI1_9SACH|nr:LAQU0S08e03070g1_1 [Lachancea quebecensis]